MKRAAPHDEALAALLEAADAVLEAAHLTSPPPRRDRPMGPALLRLLAARRALDTSTTPRKTAA